MNILIPNAEIAKDDANLQSALNFYALAGFTNDGDLAPYSSIVESTHSTAECWSLLPFLEPTEFNIITSMSLTSRYVDLILRGHDLGLTSFGKLTGSGKFHLYKLSHVLRELSGAKSIGSDQKTIELLEDDLKHFTKAVRADSSSVEFYTSTVLDPRVGGVVREALKDALKYAESRNTEKGCIEDYRRANPDHDEYAVAGHLRNLGLRPRFSTGISGCTTAGYGKLDAYGHFEFPLEEDEVRRLLAKTTTQSKGNSK